MLLVTCVQTEKDYMTDAMPCLPIYELNKSHTAAAAAVPSTFKSPFTTNDDSDDNDKAAARRDSIASDTSETSVAGSSTRSMDLVPIFED